VEVERGENASGTRGAKAVEATADKARNTQDRYFIVSVNEVKGAPDDEYFMNNFKDDVCNAATNAFV
jgi:hypothetical protein